MDHGLDRDSKDMFIGSVIRLPNAIGEGTVGADSAGDTRINLNFCP